MSVNLFLVFLSIGAGAIALWVDFRLGRRAPSTLRTALLHIGGSILVGQLAVPGLTFVLTAGGAQVYALVAIFAVGFPALTYCFLASIWLIRSVQASFRHR